MVLYTLLQVFDISEKNTGEKISHRMEGSELWSVTVLSISGRSVSQ
jgi:hypothetical protein